MYPKRLIRHEKQTVFKEAKLLGAERSILLNSAA